MLQQGSSKHAASLEQEAVRATLLRSKIPASVVDSIEVGRAALLRRLKRALLTSIARSYGHMRRNVDEFAGVVS